MPIDPKILERIANNDPKLTSLDLNNQNIDSDDMKKLCAALEKNNRLTSLNLSNNRIGEEGAIAISKILETNTTLTNVSLGGYGKSTISLKGALAMSDAIRKNSTLKSLDFIMYSTHAYFGAVLMVEALQDNISLLHLELDDPGENAELLRELLKRNKRFHEIYLEALPKSAAEENILSVARLLEHMQSEFPTIGTTESQLTMPQIRDFYLRVVNEDNIGLLTRTRMAQPLVVANKFLPPQQLSRLYNKYLDELLSKYSSNTSPENISALLAFTKIPLKAKSMNADEALIMFLFANPMGSDDANNARYRVLLWELIDQLNGEKQAIVRECVAALLGRESSKTKFQKHSPHEFVSYEQLLTAASKIKSTLDQKSFTYRLIDDALKNRNYDPDTANWLLRLEAVRKEIKLTPETENPLIVDAAIVGKANLSVMSQREEFKNGTPEKQAEIILSQKLRKVSVESIIRKDKALLIGEIKRLEGVRTINPPASAATAGTQHSDSRARFFARKDEPAASVTSHAEKDDSKPKPGGSS